MGLQFAVMIEGQEGLTWERWRRLAQAAEEAGYHALFRSDHLTGLFGDATRPVIDTWASLTWLATATRRIRFGPLVSPLTFYHPALLAKQAAAISELSGGRLDLGIGAGWHEGEHAMFGIPFPPLRERMDRLECGARAIRALWREGPATIAQPYYPLVEARITPRPAPGALPLIVGGRGERRTLRIAAEFADEWNVTRLTVAEYPQKLGVLEGHCKAVGRALSTIRRSLMIPVIVGRTAGELTARRERARAIFPRLPEDAAAWKAAGFLHGEPAQLVEELRRWEALGIGRIMLQMLDMEDLAAIELLAREVLPAFR
jgi:F420-dependent oxidoreductase-like protein